MVLTDITNKVLNSKKDHVKQMDRKETQQKENMLFNSQDLAEKLQKENMTLMKALAHERKRSELCSIEFQKLRINLRSVHEKNLQLAQANSQMLAERNTNRARLKELQHELACKNASLKVKKQLEEHVQVEEQLKDSANVSDGDCKSFQVHDIVRKATKRKRTPRIRRCVNVKPIHLNEKATRFDVQETEQTKKFLEVEEAKETARLPLRRRSARLIKRRASGVMDTTVIPEENLLQGKKDDCSSKEEHVQVEKDQGKLEVGASASDTTFLRLNNLDIQGDDAGSQGASGSCLGTMSEAVEPSDSRYTTKETNQNRRSCLGTMSEAVEPFDSRYTTKETNQNRRSCLGTMSEAVEPSDSRYTTKETNQNRRVDSFFETQRKVMWTVEEEDTLKEGVERFMGEAKKKYAVAQDSEIRRGRLSQNKDCGRSKRQVAKTH